MESVLINVLAGCTGALFVSVVHELGHVIGALLWRFTLHTVVVLNIPLYTRNRKFPIRYKHESYVVATKANPTVQELTWFIASGHILSLSFGALALAFYVVNHGWLPAPVQFALVAHIAVSLLVLLVEPFVKLSNGLRTDTQNLKAIRTEPENVILAWSFAHHIESFALRRPASIPSSVLERLKEMESTPHLYSLYRYYQHMDRSEVREARSYLEQAFQAANEAAAKDPFALATKFETAMYFARFVGDWNVSTSAYKAARKLDKKHRGAYSAVAARAYIRNHHGIAYQLAAHSVKQVEYLKQSAPEMFEHVLDWYEQIIPGFRVRYSSETAGRSNGKRKKGFFG